MSQRNFFDAEDPNYHIYFSSYKICANVEAREWSFEQAQYTGSWSSVLCAPLSSEVLELGYFSSLSFSSHKEFLSMDEEYDCIVLGTGLKVSA